MDPAPIFIKAEPDDEQLVSHSGFQVAPVVNAEAHCAPLHVQNSQPALPNPACHPGQLPHFQYLAADNLQTIQPSALKDNEANAFTSKSSSASSTSESDQKIQSLYMPLQDSRFASELGKIVRPESPTLQCRIEESDIGHIGHMLIEVNQDDMDSGNVCALTAKTLYLSNSGAVISTIDLPYYWCNFCPFKTEQKLVLLQHMMSHRFLCKLCKYQSYNRADVMRHSITTHQLSSVNNVKFCVLLPDLLQCKLASEQKIKIDKQDTPEDISKTIIQSAGSKVSCAAEVSNPVVDSVAGDGSENSITIKKPSKRGRKRKSVDSDGQSALVKMTKPSKETENTTKSECNTEEKFGVCFECCTCHMRTLQKQVIECHQQELNHYETDRTTGKKTYVLKIINATEKSSLQSADIKWLEEREETSSRRRRSKVNSFTSKKNVVNYYEDSDTEWDYGNALDDSDGTEADDDNDEDYVPTKGRKRVRKRKKTTTRGGKANEDSSVGVSKVDIEIDTAAEPSVDTTRVSSSVDVRSYSVSTLLNGKNTASISPRKIISRDLFDNCITSESGGLISKMKLERSPVEKALHETSNMCAATAHPTLASYILNSTSCASTARVNNFAGHNSTIQNQVLSHEYPIVMGSSTDASLMLSNHIPPTPGSSAQPPVPTGHTAVNSPSMANTSPSSVSVSSVLNPSSVIIIPDSANPTSTSANTTYSSSNNTFNSSNIASRYSNLSSAQARTPRMTAENIDPLEVEKTNKEIIDEKGNYKCAYCCVSTDRILQIRLHILERHKNQPLYCLDVKATNEPLPRYMLFCPFRDCHFFSNSRDTILRHVFVCDHNKRDCLSESEEKFKQINYSFIRWTFPKLLKITK